MAQNNEFCERKIMDIFIFTIREKETNNLIFTEGTQRHLLNTDFKKIKFKLEKINYN